MDGRVYDREQFGDLTTPEVQIKIGALHLDALRHRITESAHPLGLPPRTYQLPESGGCEDSRGCAAILHLGRPAYFID
jgi:hypothetical protein